MAKHLIIIAGPTASGKTKLAIDIALHLGTEIVSADSRQVYKELNIGVARPTPAELVKVKHHLIASHSIFSPLTAASFAKLAEEIIQKIDHSYAVVVGGTGLYLNALLQGIDNIPDIDEKVRKHWHDAFQKQGLSVLQNILQNCDPKFFKVGDINNPQRVLRALEVYSTTGKSITEFWGKDNLKSNFDYIGWYLNPVRNILYRNINERVDKMLTDGLWHEAENLYPHKQLPILQTIGYKEIFEYMDGKMNRDLAIEKIKQHTRNYAKRQLTWFRNKTDFIPLAPENAFETIIKNIKAG